MPPNWWMDPHNCKNFFDEFAKERHLDPLDPQTWASINCTQLYAKRVMFRVFSQHAHSRRLTPQGGRTLHDFYGNWQKALQAAYPTLALSPIDHNTHNTTLTTGG